MISDKVTVLDSLSSDALQYADGLNQDSSTAHPLHCTKLSSPVVSADVK